MQVIARRAVASLALVAAPALHAQAVRFDSTFDRDGVLVFDRRQREDVQLENLTALAVQRDGSVLVALTGQRARRESVALIRPYRTDGRLDSTFAGGQWRYRRFATHATAHSVDALALLADGRIVAAGSKYTNGRCLILFRIGPAGVEDAAMGEPTRPSLDYDCRVHGALSVAPLPDARLLVVTASLSEGTTGVIRLDSSGAPDTTFAARGMFRPAVNGTGRFVAATMADGRIVHATGWLRTNHTPLHRTSADGRVDSTFGASGTVLVPASEALADVAILDDGGMLVLNERQLARLDAEGRLVGTFGRDGVADRTFGTGGQLVFDVQRQNRTPPHPGLADFLTNSDIPLHMVLEPSGRLTVAGGAGGYQFTARLLIDDERAR